MKNKHFTFRKQIKVMLDLGSSRELISRTIKKLEIGILVILSSSLIEHITTNS